MGVGPDWRPAVATALQKAAPGLGATRADASTQNQIHEQVQAPPVRVRTDGCALEGVVVAVEDYGILCTGC